MSRSAFPVKAVFTVLAYSPAEAQQILIENLPDPAATEHDPIDSWYISDRPDPQGPPVYFLDEIPKIIQCGVTAGPWMCNRPMGHKGMHEHHAISATWGKP